MDDSANRPLDAQLAAAFDWWRDAGVDCDFLDDPVDWLAREAPEEAHFEAAVPSPAEARRMPAAPPPVRIEPGVLPQTCEHFALWWLSEPMLDQGRVADRVPPRGPQGAELMILVPQPEREDSDTLLSGPQGRLLDAMLAAMGISPETVYVASALPRHMPHADWPALHAAGFGQIAARHVSLVRPARLIAFGANVLPLLGHDPANNAAALPIFNHESGSVPLLGARDLAALLERPRWKAAFWRDWLDWAV